MPRVNGVMQLPPGSYGEPNTTIKSAPYNAVLDDFVNDANNARPIPAGGTGATSASGARTALGLAIGTNVQAYDALLQAISALTTSADKLIYTTGVDTVALATLSSFGRTLIDDADAAAARTTLGAQASSAALTSIAGLTTAADRLPYTTASNTYAVTTLTAFGRTLIDDADAATARATLGLTIGTNVQAYDAALQAISGLAVTDGGFIVGTGTTFAIETGATARASLGLVIGTNVQAYDAALQAISGLATTDGGFIVGNGSAFVLESGATARASLGLGGLSTLDLSDLVYSGSSSTNISFPIGTTIAVFTDSTLYNLGATVTIRLGSAADFYSLGSGTVVSGTWRCRGTISGERQFFQRVS